MHHRAEDPRCCLILRPEAFEVVEAVLLGTGDVFLYSRMRQVRQIFAQLSVCHRKLPRDATNTWVAVLFGNDSAGQVEH
jgi:hypothetical protein